MINKKVESVKTLLDANKMKYQIIGEGDKVIKQTPSKDTTITNKDVIYLITNDEKLSVPNLKGTSSKVAKEVNKNSSLISILYSSIALL